MINDAPVYHEAHYREGRTSETERLDDAPVTRRITRALATFERSNAGGAPTGFLLALGCFVCGWWARSAFPNDYTVLAWIVPVVTFAVAYGNRRKGS